MAQHTAPQPGPAGNPHTNISYLQCSQLFIHIASHTPPPSTSQSRRARLVLVVRHHIGTMECRLVRESQFFFFFKPTHFINTFIFVTAVRDTRGFLHKITLAVCKGFTPHPRGFSDANTSKFLWENITA